MYIIIVTIITISIKYCSWYISYILFIISFLQALYQALQILWYLYVTMRAILLLLNRKYQHFNQDIRMYAYKSTNSHSSFTSSIVYTFQSIFYILLRVTFLLERCYEMVQNQPLLTFDWLFQLASSPVGKKFQDVSALFLPLVKGR